MNASTWVDNIYRSDTLPPMHVKKSVKESDKWKKSVLDSFEHLAITQFRENLEFNDYYRMVDNDIAFQDLRDVLPQYGELEDLLDGVGVPTMIRHYDIMGLIIRALVGKYIEMQDKYYVKDLGEIAENEFLRFKTEEVRKLMQKIVDNTLKTHLAEKGLTEEGQQFESEEQRQQFLQQLEEEKRKIIPQDLDRNLKRTFKSTGRKWGEATLEKDKEMMKLDYLEKEEMKDLLISGRFFRQYIVGEDSYKPVRWSPKNTFFSKEMGSLKPQEGEYIGRVNWMTPAEVEATYGHEMDSVTTKKLLGGNTHWKSFTAGGDFAGNIESAIQSNFNKPQRVPFSGFYDTQFYLGLQDETGIPLGEYTSLTEEGGPKTYDRYLPRMMDSGFGRYSENASIIRNDFQHRRDLCQVTEVYFRAYDYVGYLTYENDFGATVTEMVTEDILKDFLKEKGIKQTYKESRVDIIKDFELNTLKWTLKPVVYEGVKITTPNDAESIYLYCRPMEHQIKGDGDFDVLLPVGGYIGKSYAKKIAPFQSGYNLCLNQINSLLEKEIGMFFLFDVNMIPSEYTGQGDATDALINFRNTVKDLGFAPVATNPDNKGPQSTFNQFAVHDISFTKQIANRVELAEYFQNKAFEAIGINRQMLAEPTKYQTAEGVKVSQESSYAQIAEIFEEFSMAKQGILELHLSVAQFAQSTGKDLSIMYTKDDASIEYLKIADPYLPLRRLGIIPASNPKKRKQLEEFKSYLMQTNTLGADTLEVARLLFSDVTSEAMEIAKIERERRLELQEIEHKRRMAEQEQQAMLKEQEEQAKWNRNEISREADRQAKKDIEVIKAVGIASGKDSTEESFDQIEKVREETRVKENAIQSEYELAMEEFKQKDRDRSQKIEQYKQQLELKLKELDLRKQKIESDERIALYNKN